MVRLTDRESVPFALILFPLEYQVVDETYSTLAQELMVRRASQARIPVLDLLPAYRQACQDKEPNGCRLEDRYLFADVWMHPSVLGHTLTATALEAFLWEAYPTALGRMTRLIEP